MKKIFFYIILLACFSPALKAQETVYPAKPQTQTIVLYNGTIHRGNGEVITNAVVIIEKGKISYAGPMVASDFKDAKVIDVAGKQIYPGLILPSSTLGLTEIGSNAGRPMNDFSEVGDMNSDVRSIVAYNTDSKIINTLRSNGVLVANVIPQGGTLAGLSSVVQLDAWNWEDAAYKTDNGVNFNMPELINRPNPFAAFFGVQQPQTDPVKQALETIEKVKIFFREAKAWFAATNHKDVNLKYEAVRGLFDNTQKLYISCNTVKQMLIAIDFVKEFGFDVVVVGGSDSWQIADLLKQNNISVILSQEHSLPTLPDDDIDQPYKTPAALQKAGVLFALNDDDNQNRGRNIAFNAGTASAYGMTREEALTAITLNAAKILGIADRTGSIEAGKDANIIVSEGDILDMRTNIITMAWIQGRQIDLTNKQTQLYERYKYKYGLK